MGVTFTPDQKKVIELHHRNILVSAAAGSGKTAVLVERIIQMILDPKESVDVDRLLVLTFTNAAAAEMRERILVAINKKLEEHPEDQHMQKQAALIHNAQITTIHKFCLFVIQNHFHEIGLDPKYRIGDEGEIKLLSAEILDAIIEEEHEKAETDFLECVETFAGNKTDEKLEDLILSLYHFSMSCPYPVRWLEECRELYQIDSLEELEELKIMEVVVGQMKAILSDCFAMMNEAFRLTGCPDGPYMFGELLEQEKELFEELQKADSYLELSKAIESIEFGRLSSKKDESVDLNKRELVKNLRDQVKASVKTLKKNYINFSPELLIEGMKQSMGPIRTLIDLTIKFEKKIREEKREKGILDFYDMEHLALQILVDEKTGLPSKAAKEYQEYFHEILIDEYQDSNLVQETILRSVSKEDQNEFNRFMVGDVKQSIYRFRQARPEIFMEKYKKYSKIESKEQRIDLSTNFRSREEVIEGINRVFKQIMAEDLGKIAYDKEAQLYPGLDYPQYGKAGCEMLLLDDEIESKDKKASEALMIAEKIKELISSYEVVDKESGKMRPARYRDIVILLRTNSGWDQIFSQTLMQEGIPAHTISRTGYFETTEISGILNYLRILDNPLQDLPLFGVLNSHFGRFTEEELAKVEIVSEDRIPLLKKLERYSETYTNDLSTKINKFLEQIRKYRLLSEYTPVKKLLIRIMNETNYRLVFATLPGGEQRAANLDMLIEKAGDFENTSYYGLFHFIRYMEQIQKYEVDYGEANLLGEAEDVVRIMSIHKSKGLEFPICFLSGIHKKFNEMDVRNPVLFDVDYGIASDWTNLSSRTKTPTLSRGALATKIKLENLGEEIRILYVAMTRAKEKLILTGVVNGLEDMLLKYQAFLGENNAPLPFLLRSKAQSYLDLLLPAIIKDANTLELEELGEKRGNRFQVKIKKEAELIFMDRGEQIRQEDKRKFLESYMDDQEVGDVNEKESFEKLLKKIDFTYPENGLEQLFLKTTVSELKHRELEEEGLSELFPENKKEYLPSFEGKKEEVPGTVRGSAYHKVMELLEFDFEDASIQLQKMKESGRLTQVYFGAVNPEKIEMFSKTILFKRMKKAALKEKLFREQPFVLGIPANKIQKEFPETEMILIQGVMDAYFEENEELILVDYKTDRILRLEELVERYKVQMDYYKEALERLTDKKVRECILYSFALNKEITI